MGEAQSVIEAPQSRFRVRFTRARGFAALFERPENTFQWSGYGTLRVERSGVQFHASRRGPTGLAHAEAHFVPGREIRNVYREADGVRVEFREGDQPTFLNFWAEDSAAAASIVEQLPTARTVEVEDARRDSARPPRAFRVVLIGPIALALVLIAAGAWLGVRWMKDGGADAVGRSTANSDGLSRAEASASGTGTGNESSTAAASAGAPSAVAVSPEELALLKADFARFSERSGVLQAQFKSAFKALQDGALTQENFAGGVERWIVPQWASEEAELRAIAFTPGSRREELRTLQISVTGNWRNGLETYASGLRTHETRIVYQAFAYIAAAEEAERSARELLEP